MKQKLEDRLTELKAEFESGQRALAELEARQANMRDYFAAYQRCDSGAGR